MYLTRTIEDCIRKADSFFSVVLLTGPRQTGKTTVLRHCESGQRTYVSLDTLDNRQLAKTDPALFLQRYKPPVLIDEIQYAPGICCAYGTMLKAGLTFSIRTNTITKTSV